MQIFSLFLSKFVCSTHNSHTNCWNVGKIKKDSHVSGFVGNELKKDFVGTVAFAVEKYGRGQIIYMSDSPVFRGFWHSGKLILGNAIFLVGQ